MSAKLPGSLYRRADTGGYYWKICPPGEKKPRGIAMRPKGGPATKSKAVAETIARRMLAEWKQGYTLIKGLDEILNEWEAVEASRSSARNAWQYRKEVKLYFDQALSRRIFDQSNAEVETYLVARMADSAPATVRRIRVALNRFWRFCIKRGHVSNNPVTLTDSPRVYQRPPRYLPHGVIRELYRRLAGSWLSLAVEVGLTCGLRLSEIRNLRVKDKIESGLLVGSTVTTKTYQSRVVPLSVGLSRRLPVRGEFMFPRHDTRWWVRQLKAKTSGLPVFGELKGNRAGNQWHLLRSTWAVNQARRGIGLWRLMALGGWTTPQTVMRYINLVRASER